MYQHQSSVKNSLSSLVCIKKKKTVEDHTVPDPSDIVILIRRATKSLPRVSQKLGGKGAGLCKPSLKLGFLGIPETFSGGMGAFRGGVKKQPDSCFGRLA